MLRFQVYLLLGTKVEPVCADLRDSFQTKGRDLSSLRDSCVFFNHLLCSTWAAAPVLTCAAGVSMHVFVQGAKGSGGGGKACNRLVAGGPVTFGSVRHGSSPISSSPLLLLPLFFSSSNSIAIKELRRDPNAASSVIKTISCEDGLCHLNCLFRAHVTPNSPCVAGLSEDINSLPARLVQQFTQPVSSSFVTSV